VRTVKKKLKTNLLQRKGQRVLSKFPFKISTNYSTNFPYALVVMVKLLKFLAVHILAMPMTHLNVVVYWQLHNGGIMSSLSGTQKNIYTFGIK
jgi:hypothetical protein